MLEAIRQNSRSTIIYVLFGVLIAVFVINFGPGSGGCGGTLSSSYAAHVAGSTVTEADYRLLYVALGATNIPPAMARERKLKEFVMDKLIERELLAQDAEKLGFSVSDKEVEDLLATGKMYILSVPRRADEFMVDGAFDYKRFSSFVENRLGVSVQHFIDLQRREMLAEKVKQAMATATRVTPDEAKADYVQRETQSNLEFVRFSPRSYDGEVTLTPEEIADYRQKHADDIKKQYEDRSFLYKNVERSLRGRLILVEVPKPAGDAKPDEALAAAAEKKAQGLRAQLDKGDFAAIARASSDDASTKSRGGDLGWRKAGLTGFPKELEDKVFAAKPGDIIGPEKTERGFEIVKVEKFRQGDVSLDDAAPEIAEDKARTEKAKVLAKAAADAAVKAHAADKTLAVEFPRPGANPGEDDKAPPPPANAAFAEETGLFPRGSDRVNGIGLSAEIMKTAFTLAEGAIAGPFEVDNTWVVVRVKERKQADMKAWDEKKDELLRQLERQKWADVLESYLKQRCVEARDAKRIDANPAVLSYDGSGEEPSAPSTYIPCGNRL